MSPNYETGGDLTRHKSIYHDLYQPSQVRVPSSELALVRFWPQLASEVLPASFVPFFWERYSSEAEEPSWLVWACSLCQ
jgi:hypothetical protein